MSFNWDFRNRHKAPPKTTGKFRTRKELEEEVMRMRKSGETLRAIANAVKISEATVHVIVRNCTENNS